MNAVIISTINTNQPHHFIETSDWPIPQNLRLADKGFHTPGPIDVLIGASLFFDLLLLGQIKVKDVVLQKTHLGWIVSGECRTSSPPHSPPPYKSFLAISEESAADQALERFWAMEEAPSQSSAALTQEELNYE